MTTKQQYIDAAKILPKNRTPAQQALVDKGRVYQEVRNTDFEARRTQSAQG